MNKTATLAGEILTDLTAVLDAGEELRKEDRGISVRLRLLLNMTESLSDQARQARLTILEALGRTEIGDQIRRSGGCHAGVERVVDFPENTQVELLVDGLRQLACMGDNST